MQIRIRNHQKAKNQTNEPDPGPESCNTSSPLKRFGLACVIPLPGVISRNDSAHFANTNFTDAVGEWDLSRVARPECPSRPTPALSETAETPNKGLYVRLYFIGGEYCQQRLKLCFRLIYRRGRRGRFSFFCQPRKQPHDG